MAAHHRALRYLVIILALLMLTPTVLYGQSSDAEWTVLGVATLDGAGNLAYDSPNYLLSPDDSTLAWMDATKSLCLMTLAFEDTTCQPTPPQFPNVSLLKWSPNAHYLLLLDGFGEFSAELAFEVSTGDFHLIEDNRTVWSRLIWNANSDAIYYLSYEYEGGIDFTLLRRFSMISKQETAFDLATVFNTPLLFESLALVSPDDTQFVVQLRTSHSPDIETGLWLVSIDTQEAKHLATSDDLAVGLPPEQSFLIADMLWDTERNRLLLTVDSSMQLDETFNVLSLDLATGAVLPLLPVDDTRVSFSSGILTPDGEFFFYFDELDPSDPSQKTIFALPVATSDSEPIMVILKLEVIDCTPISLLITLGYDDSTKRYIYEPRFPCPR